MVVSNKIEQWALQGKCIWRTFNTGYSSTATIPVPNGSFILLRQIIVYPFLPNVLRTNSQTSRRIWQLVTCEQGNNNELVYAIRNSSIPGNDPAYKSEHPNAPHTIETWAVYRKNVVVDLMLFPNVTRATFAPLDLLQPSADERPNKIGYGGVPVIPEITLNADDVLYPTGETRPFAATPYAGFGIIDRLRIKAQGSLQIPVPDQTNELTNDFEIPLITFGYWEFKNATPESLV